ncbi:MAG: hypothetical protein DHS20C10_13430 [marine bacterium B5-7]|nr:MAG: hypothetical protein DHS20C10_13430 [marine bacterium B5-7]
MNFRQLSRCISGICKKDNTLEPALTSLRTQDNQDNDYVPLDTIRRFAKETAPFFETTTLRDGERKRFSFNGMLPMLHQLMQLGADDDMTVASLLKSANSMYPLPDNQLLMESLTDLMSYLPALKKLQALNQLTVRNVHLANPFHPDYLAWLNTFLSLYLDTPMLQTDDSEWDAYQAYKQAQEKQQSYMAHLAQQLEHSTFEDSADEEVFSPKEAREQKSKIDAGKKIHCNKIYPLKKLFASLQGAGLFTIAFTQRLLTPYQHFFPNVDTETHYKEFAEQYNGSSQHTAQVRKLIGLLTLAQRQCSAWDQATLNTLLADTPESAWARYWLSDFRYRTEIQFMDGRVPLITSDISPLLNQIKRLSDAHVLTTKRLDHIIEHFPGLAEAATYVDTIIRMKEKSILPSAGRIAIGYDSYGRAYPLMGEKTGGDHAMDAFACFAAMNPSDFSGTINLVPANDYQSVDRTTVGRISEGVFYLLNDEVDDFIKVVRQYYDEDTSEHILSLLYRGELFTPATLALWINQEVTCSRREHPSTPPYYPKALEARARLLAREENGEFIRQVKLAVATYYTTPKSQTSYFSFFRTEGENKDRLLALADKHSADHELQHAARLAQGFYTP